MHSAGRPRATTTLSQGWAFCPPPCRKTSSGGVLPQRTVLIVCPPANATFSRSGVSSLGQATPISSAFSATRANSSYGSVSGNAGEKVSWFIAGPAKTSSLIEGSINSFEPSTDRFPAFVVRQNIETVVQDRVDGRLRNGFHGDDPAGQRLVRHALVPQRRSA